MEEAVVCAESLYRARDPPRRQLHHGIAHASSVEGGGALDSTVGNESLYSVVPTSLTLPRRGCRRFRANLLTTIAQVVHTFWRMTGDTSFQTTRNLS